MFYSVYCSSKQTSLLQNKDFLTVLGTLFHELSFQCFSLFNLFSGNKIHWMCFYEYMHEALFSKYTFMDTCFQEKKNYLKKKINMFYLFVLCWMYLIMLLLLVCHKKSEVGKSNCSLIHVWHTCIWIMTSTDFDPFLHIFSPSYLRENYHVDVQLQGTNKIQDLPYNGRQRLLRPFYSGTLKSH